METRKEVTLYHKLIVCVLAGLVLAASFDRLAQRFIGWIVPGLLLTVTTALLLIGPIVFAFAWAIRRKREISNETILLVWQGFLRFGLAFDLAVFGWFKIFRLQFWVPIEKLDEPFGSISSNWLTWMYFGRSYPMDFSIGVTQLIASFLLLFNKTRLIGVFVMIPVLLNVFLIDLFYKMGAVTIHAGIMLTGVTYLLFSEYGRLKQFFLLSTERLPAIKMSQLVKVALRCSLIVVPLLFIFLRKSADIHPQLKGKYEVRKLSINKVDLTSSINCDSVLSIMYLENGNTCILQFKDYQQRIIGTYDYRKADNKFVVKWLRPEDYSRLNENYDVKRQVPDFNATLVPGSDFHFMLSGKIDDSSIEVEMVKVK